MNWLILEPNWLLVCLVSAFFGMLLPLLIGAFRYLFRRIVGSAYNGVWHHYYFNYDQYDLSGSPKLHHERLKITSGFRSKLKVVSVHLDKDLTYSGTVTTKKGMFLLRMHCRKNDEHVFEMFRVPTMVSSTILVGLALAEDFDGRPAAAPVLLAKNELSHSKVCACISNYVIFDQDKCVMALHQTAVKKEINRQNQRMP